MLKRLEAFFKVTEPSITTLIAEANARADRAEGKFRDLEARVKRLTDCLNEDHLEAADIMGVDAFSYLIELITIKQKQLFTTDQIGVLAPYCKDGKFPDVEEAEALPIVALCDVGKNV